MDHSEALVAVEDVPNDLVGAPREFIVDTVYLGPVHLGHNFTQFGQISIYPIKKVG